MWRQRNRLNGKRRSRWIESGLCCLVVIVLAQSAIAQQAPSQILSQYRAQRVTWMTNVWPFANNLPHSISYIAGAPLQTNLLHWLRHDAATSLGWDLARGAGDFLFIFIAGRPVLLALRRAARRAAFDAPVEFAPLAS